MMLRRLRMVAGFTQEELAERAGISVYSISNIERDVPHTPRPETLRFLTQALQLSRHETAQVVAHASSLHRTYRMRNVRTTTETASGSTTLSQAIMYATVGWLALCMERVAVAVDIQPIAEGVYEVSAHFDAERTEGVLLRVRLEVAPGLVVRTVVEPVRPA